MRFLSPRKATIGYVAALSIIGGLMAFVVSGVTAIDGSKQRNVASKITMLDRR